MPPVPSIRGSRLVCAPERAGFKVHPGRDVAKGTLRNILHDTGMSVDELRRLL